MAEPEEKLEKTALYDLHVELGAKMVPFAGYSMPVTFPAGLMKEHRATREAAGLFDVSHMGQCYVHSDSWEKTARALEALVPADLLGLKPGRQRYTQLLNEEGGILDDLMITRLPYEGLEGWAYIVVNAACQEADYRLIGGAMPADVKLQIEAGLSLIALQGPKAAEVLAGLVPEVETMAFMSCLKAPYKDTSLHISRSGYTGEDGYEISVIDDVAGELARTLLADERVTAVGLGARDTLRLEAGLCLYGHDIDEATSPVEADLAFSLGKRRLEEGGFPGSERIQREMAGGVSRKRVGLKLEGRAPAREGCDIVARGGSEPIGKVTSGTFSPSVGKPIAMGYLPAELSEPGTEIDILIRGKPNAASVTAMPFIPKRFYRKPKSGIKNG